MIFIYLFNIVYALEKLIRIHLKYLCIFIILKEVQHFTDVVNIVGSGKEF